MASDQNSAFETLLRRLESVTTRLESVQGATFSSAPPQESASQLSHPSQIVDGSAASVDTSSASDYISQTNPAIEALLGAAAPLGLEKPSANELPGLVGPVAAHMQAATALTEGRRGAFFNHQKTVADALLALSWMVYTGHNCGLSVPPKHVEDSWQSAEFFANKILMEFRNSDSHQVDWVKALKTLFMQLKDYLKQHHGLGPSWNTRGVLLKDYKPGSTGAAPKPKPASAPAPASAPPAPAKGGPAAPPPPPPGSLFQPKGPAAGPAAKPTSGMSAIFSEINKGGGVTTGLKKVTDDMKTKNRADRSGAVPSSTPTSSASTGKAAQPSVAASAPPKTELVLGRKWTVENHKGNRALVIDQTDPKQSVYIFNCHNSTVQVQGKVNAITLDSCSRTGLVFQDIVSSCEVVNCSSVEVQSTGVMPTIAIDKTDGIVLYLSEVSLGVAITTAKSSAINVVVPGDGNSDPLELPVPEQFVSTFKEGKLVTEAVTHSGA